MLSEKIIQELKEKLLEEKGKIEKSLSVLGKPTKKEGDYETAFKEIGTDLDENASEVEEYVDDLAVEQSLEAQLKELNEALKEIEDGTYGICKNCGETMSLERLRVYPAARTCIKCAKKD